MGSTKAEREFREQTITILTRLDTQVKGMIEAQAADREVTTQVARDLRAETQNLHKELIKAIHEHTLEDDQNFESLGKAQSKLMGKVNRFIAFTLGANAVIVVGLEAWRTLHH